MSTEVISKHNKLIDITESMLKQLEDPGPDLREELCRSDALDSFVEAIDNELAASAVIPDDQWLQELGKAVADTEF